MNKDVKPAEKTHRFLHHLLYGPLVRNVYRHLITTCRVIARKVLQIGDDSGCPFSCETVCDCAANSPGPARNQSALGVKSERIVSGLWR